MEGKMEFVPSWIQPEIKMETKYFYTSQFYGMIGTVVPFTKEYAVTAVDQTSVYNIPASFKLKLSVPEQKLRMSVKMVENLSRPIKMIHRHVRPFTAIQKVESIMPISLSEEVQMVRSPNQLKEHSYQFGDVLGMKFESVYRTEARYADWQSLVERFALYKYNPINMITFYWTSVSLNHESSMIPLSLRRQVYTVMYHPSQSQTKELAIDLKIGYAVKSQESEQVHYKKVKVISEAEKLQEASLEKDLLKKALKSFIPIKIESEPVHVKSAHPERQEKIVQALEQIQIVPSQRLSSEIERVQAVTLKVSTTLVSSRPTTWSYVATIAGAQGAEAMKIKTKWNVVLQDQQSAEKIVAKGHLQAPLLPIWNTHAIRSSMIDFRYMNTLEMHRSGSKVWSIDIEGSSRTSEEQKEFSKISQEAVQCEKLIEKSQSGEKGVLAKLSEPCQKMREQARTIDEVDFSIRYHNVPHVEYYETKAASYLKLGLWPFLRLDLSEQKSIEGQSVAQGPHSAKIEFRQIRLPYGLNHVLPLKAGLSNAKLIAKKVTGSVLYPVCKIEGQALKTFDNKTLPVDLDRCYHLVAADCSEQKSFAVLLRELSSESKREVKIILGQSEIKLIPEGSSDIKVVVLKSSRYSLSITFDGKDIAIESSQLTKKGQLCGICGNQNQAQKDDVEGPKKCMYSKPEVEQASYRLRDEPRGCEAQKPLSQLIKQQLERENQQCHQKYDIPTKISKSLRTQQGECTILKHAVVKRPGQICISKKPVTQCSAGCKPSHSDLLEKRIPFVCLREDRMAEHYAKKAERGEQMPELESHSSAFETRVPQPRSCVLATNEL